MVKITPKLTKKQLATQKLNEMKITIYKQAEVLNDDLEINQDRKWSPSQPDGMSALYARLFEMTAFL